MSWILKPKVAEPKARIDRGSTKVYIGGSGKSPGNYEVGKGEKVRIYVRVCNDGGEGTVYALVNDEASGVIIAEKYEDVPAGGSLTLDKEFTVDKDMEIKVYAGHWNGSKWVCDDSYGG